MAFIEILFGILLAIAAKRGESPDDQMRIHQVAQDQWLAVQSSKNLPVVGEAGQEASAIALAAFSGHESGFWSKVQDCSACFIGSQWCDKGRSVSLYQLREGSGAWGSYTREQLCEDNTLATERALHLLNRHRRSSTTLGLFKLGGRKGAAEEMDALYHTHLMKVGIVVSYSDGALTAKWREGRKPVEPDDPTATPGEPLSGGIRWHRSRQEAQSMEARLPWASILTL